jgi:hypothetical protein
MLISEVEEELTLPRFNVIGIHLLAAIDSLVRSTGMSDYLAAIMSVCELLRILKSHA